MSQAHRPSSPGRRTAERRWAARVRGRRPSRLRGRGAEMLRDETDLQRELLDALVDDERAVPGVISVFLERLPQLTQTVAIHVDAARRTARIVLANEQQHRNAYAIDVGDRIREPITLRYLRRGDR